VRQEKGGHEKVEELSEKEEAKQKKGGHEKGEGVSEKEEVR
jgi:hypothetical protein